jgi:hypothetical protein
MLSHRGISFGVDDDLDFTTNWGLLDSIGYTLQQATFMEESVAYVLFTAN